MCGLLYHIIGMGFGGAKFVVVDAYRKTSYIKGIGSGYAYAVEGNRVIIYNYVVVVGNRCWASAYIY